jgi:hypothetical protein
VTAKGIPDVQLDWLADLNLSLAKLYGKLCGTILDVSKGKDHKLDLFVSIIIPFKLFWL